MRALFLLIPFLLLAACGKSDNSSSTGAITVAPDGGTVGTVTQTSNSYSYTSGLQGTPPYVFANYQFKENGCDTDLHKFSSPLYGATLAQLCAGLRNEWMNHSCAPDLRYAYAAQLGCQ
jgi:hypothetical protein